MIEQVTNLTKKSFKNYTGPSDKFKLKNVVFGYNGRGKSSLATGLKEAYSDDASNHEDNMRFFNKDYVEDSLSLEDPATGTRMIKGVIAHFGKGPVGVKKKIKELQEKLVDTKPIQAGLDTLKSDARKAVDAIHDRRKGTASITKKDKDLDIQKVIELYTQDLDKAKKIEADEAKLSKIQGDNIIGEKIELIKTVSFQDYAVISDQDIKDAAAVFTKTFTGVNIPPTEVVDWLNAGLALHEDGDDCKFCHNKITLKDITSRVEEYNANEKQKATKTLQGLDTKMAELQNIIKANTDKRANTESALDEDKKITDGYDSVIAANIVITNARNAIKAKIKNIDDTKLVFVDFTDALKQFNDAIKSLTDIKNSQLTKIEEQNINKDVLVKGAIGLEIVNDQNIQGKLTDIIAKDKELTDTTTANEKINDDIQKLKQAESATADFADYISAILANLNIHLKLIISSDGKNYVIQHTQSSTSLEMTDISEGERNLLALLFFYYELFNDNEQQDFKNNIDLIIVDDPISSMDDINKMYILELMKQILSLSTPQVFVMTHSWDDFSGLCYGLFDKAATPTQPATPYGFYEIKKDASSDSFVQKTKSNIPPYHHNFAEVYEFSQRPDITSLDDCDTYHTPNIMRQVLEGFLSFKTHKNSPTKNNEIEIGRILFDKEWAKVTEAEKTELGQLLLVTNVNSHSSSRSPDEIWKASKFLMKRIKVVDKRHYDTNKGPIL